MFIRSASLIPCLLTLLLVVASSVSHAQDRAYPPKFKGAKEQTYREVDGVKLSCWIIEPKMHAASDKKPCILFFFGGGWTSGTPSQFVNQAQHFAERGMVAILCDYRVASRHKVAPAECVSDARAAVAWTKSQADKLGVDPSKIVVAGGSAGGHLAACCGTLPTDAKELPAAMILFNPALITAPVDGKFEISEARAKGLFARFGKDPAKLSPYHHIRKELPPTLILHGKADSTVPYASVELFTEAMKSAGNRCELVGYDDAAHGFFNYGRGDNAAYRATLTRADEFLVSLQLLSPPKGADK